MNLNYFRQNIWRLSSAQFHFWFMWGLVEHSQLQKKDLQQNPFWFKQATETKGCEWNFEDQLNVALKTHCKYFLTIKLKEIFGRYLPHEGGLRQKNYFLLFFSARANWLTHRISDLSDPPFMFFANNFSNIWHNFPLFPLLTHSAMIWNISFQTSTKTWRECAIFQISSFKCVTSC